MEKHDGEETRPLAGCLNVLIPIWKAGCGCWLLIFVGIPVMIFFGIVVWAWVKTYVLGQ